MKKLVRVVTAFAAVGFINVASAADMPVKAPVAVAPVYNWTGFYFGGHAGAVWSNIGVTDVDGFAAGATAGTLTTLNGSGFIGGGQAGYNWQTGMFVFGLEGDLGYMGLHKSGLLTGTASSTTVGINSGLYGDITGRLGFLLNNNFLLYGKGGWAFFTGQNSFSTLAAFTANTTNTFSGWTAGAGVEWKFAPSWTAKIEYQHFDFGSQSYSLTPPTFVFNEKLRADAVMLGVNYLFGR